MVEVTMFRNMRKEVNSTATPGGGNFDSSTVYSCVLFEPCSVQNPKIWLAVNIQADIHNYNYAYIPHFSRYYWVTDLSFMDGRWLVSLACDTLASFKNAIGSSEQYILRSSTLYDTEITDTLYPPTGGKVQEMRSSGGTPFATSVANGTFVLGISTGGEIANSTIGSTAFIALTYAEMTNLINALWGSVSYMNLTGTDLDENIAKVIINPMQYIQSCKWYPFQIPVSGGYSALKFGWWSIGVTARGALTGGAYRRVAFSMDIPEHPQAADRGGFLNREPYAQYWLEFPMIGNVEIPANVISNSVPKKLLVDTRTDLITGLCEIRLSQVDNPQQPGQEIDLGLTSCNMAVDIPLAQVAVDKMGGISQAVSAGASGIGRMLTGDIIGGISTLVDGAISGASSFATPLPSFMGTAGNMTSIQRIPKLFGNFQRITDDASAKFGKPYCRNAVINTLSGFVMCGRTHIALPGATKAETQEVESFMNEGFFYE